MKFMKARKTVFYKIMISYIVLSSIIIMEMSLSFYYSVSKNYHKEISVLNENILNYAQNVIDENLMQRAEKVCQDLLVWISYNESIVSDLKSVDMWNLSDARTVYNYICETARYNTEILESIHVYFTTSEGLISTRSGIVRNRFDKNNRFLNLDWIDEFEKSGKQCFWLSTRDIFYSPSFSIKAFTVVKSMQYSYKGEKGNIYVALDIDAEVLSKRLKQVSRTEDSGVLMIDSDGTAIAGTSEEYAGSNLAEKEYVSKILSDSKESDVFRWKRDRKNVVVSYTTFRQNNWRLVFIMPSEYYYKASFAMKRSMFLAILFTIIMAVILTKIFTGHIYHPLKNIINSIVGGDGRKNVNEFDLIDETFKRLSIDKKNLRGMLELYEPQIKQNFVNCLISHTIENEGSLAERLKLLGSDADAKGIYRCAVLEFDKGAYETLDLEVCQYLKYVVLEKVDQLCEDKGEFIASEVLGSVNRIAIICAESSREEAEKLFCSIARQMEEEYMVQVITAWGIRTNGMLCVYRSYESVLKALSYRWLFPAEKILYAEVCEEREKSDLVPKLPEQTIFLSALKERDLSEAQRCLEKITEELVNGKYSIAHCHEEVLSLVSAVAGFMRENSIKSEQIIERSLQEDFLTTGNIHEFRQWLMSVISSTMDALGGQDNQRYSELIAEVKNYCRENLGGDLSLTGIAENIFISPKYLSHLFKEKTGQNLTEYIFGLRMEKSVELLRETDYNIEKIAGMVGFNTPHYFIKKFKEVYGVTPKKYKLRN